MSFNSKINYKSIKEVSIGLIYPVYISSRVVKELVKFCKDTTPKEALGFLLGLRLKYKENLSIEYTKITDWVTGSVESSHVSANFTTDGLEQASRFLDDKYGLHREQSDETPKIVGIVHSHPFGLEPEFSHIDLDTFLNFPYDAEGNVFILIDPIPNIPYFKVYKIINDSGKGKTLQHVPWVEYSAIKTDIIDLNSENVEIINISPKEDSINDNEDPYKPPKIEKIKNSELNKLKKKVNLREYF